MSGTPWTPERQRQLVELARRGLTGAEIAARLGLTRSAVLGRAFRTGVTLPMTHRKRAILVECGRASTGRRGAHPVTP